MAKEVNKRVNVWINGKEVENNVKSIRAAMVQLTNQLNKMDIGSAEYIETSKKLRDLKAIYDEHCKSLKMTNQEIENNTTSWKKNIIHWGAFAAAAQGASAAIQRFVAATQEYVDAYATLDDAMSAVQKTTGMTREEVEGLHKSLKSIDTRTSTNELLKISEIGGRMGIAKDQIQGFTEAVNKANVALGDSFQGGAEEISSILGKISLAYKETRDQDIGKSLTQIGSALNEVGASANATEGNIAAFVQRMGSMPEVFRPTVQQAVALGAAFEESSIDAEVASRAFGIVMTKASTNVEKFATAMHRPIEEVRELINTNPAQFFVEFAESLNGLNATEVGSVLKDLKLNADGVNKIIGAMSTNTERFTEILNTSNTAFAEAVSLDKEYAVVNENAAAQLEKAKKAVEDAKAELGKELLPTLAKITKSTASVIKIVTTAVKWISEHKALVIALAVAYNRQYIAQMAVIGAKKISAKWTAIEKAGESAGTVVTNLFALAKAKLARNTLAAANAQKALKLAFAATPWGAIITAVTTLATAFVLLKNKTGKAADATTGIETDFKDINKTIADNSAGSITLFRKLCTQYAQLGDSMKEKKQFIKDNKAAFDELGISIQSVNDAENAFVNNKDNFVKSLLERAKASAYQSEAQKVFAKSTQLYEEYQQAATELEYYLGNLRSKSSQSEYYVVGRGNDVEQRRIEELRKNLEKYREQIEAVEKEAESYLKLQLDSEKKAELYLTNGGITESSANVTDAVLKQRETFQKKLAQMRTKEQSDLLTGWEKTRQQIIDKYKEMEDEAKRLYGENSQMLKDVQAQRNQAIVEAGQKYVQDMEKVISKSADEIKNWGKELGNAGSNEIIDAVLGVKVKWEQRTAEVKKTLDDLMSTRYLMVRDGMDTTAIDEQIAKLEQHLKNVSDLTVQEINKTYQKYEKQIADFVTAEAKVAKEATMTEVEKQKAAIQERYQLEIDKINKLIAAKLQNEVVDEAEIQSLRDKIELLKRMQAEAEAAVIKQASGGLRGKSIWQQLAEFDWRNLATNWRQGLNLMNDALNEFASSAMSIFNTINQMQSNREQAEFDSYCKMQDDKAKNLQDRLDKGLISQEKYDAEIAKMEEEKEAKEKQMKHEQFERERRSSLAEVLIQGGIAVARAFADYGWPWGLIPAALSTAQTAEQTAMIASQVNPYARGGYIDREQLALMGEEGQEWVASNRLLTDKKTAPVISALERYQRGDIKALEMLRVPEPSWEKLSQSSQKLSRTFAQSTPVNNYYYTNSNNTTTSDNSELLAVMKRIDAYLRDPKNRQAVISRKMQLEFDRMETEIKQLARL